MVLTNSDLNDAYEGFEHFLVIAPDAGEEA